MSQPEVAQQAVVQAIISHHAQLAGGLDQRVEAVVDSVATDRLLKAEKARQDLLDYLRREIIPHARAEERALYPPAAAVPEGRLLVTGMIDEHRSLTDLVAQLAAAADTPVRAAAAARALAALFAVHLHKENDLVLPLLAATPGVRLATILAGMRELLGEHAVDRADHADHAVDRAEQADRAVDRADHADHAVDRADHADHAVDRADQTVGADQADGGVDGLGTATEAAEDGCGCGGCGCGGDREQADGADAAAPVLTVDTRLDVRDVPHSQRHALVLSTVAALPPGQAVVLVAGHAPRPVLAEIDDRFGANVQTQWLQSGPDVWQVRLERVAVPS